MNYSPTTSLWLSASKKVKRGETQVRRQDECEIVHICVYIGYELRTWKSVVWVGSCLVPGFQGPPPTSQGFRGFLAARYVTKAYVRYLIC